MRARLVSLGAALLLAACASAPEAAPGLRVDGNRMFLPVTVNGTASEALLDSGAEMSLIDTRLAADARLAAFGADEMKGSGAGTQSVQFAEGVTIEAAGQTLQPEAVAILDLTDISERVVGQPVAMVLGRELFDAGRFELDVARRSLKQVSRDIEPAGAEMPLTDADGIKQFEVEIDGRKVMADFDLGNGNEVLLSRPFAQAAGLLDPARVIGTKEGGGIGGPVERTIVRVGMLKIGGRTLTGVTAAVNPKDEGAQANVGLSILRDFRMTIDFAQNKLWLEPL
ncbi:MAG: aspartyl protease family protein [Acidobacteria bacterium]|nr:aspartyl protease family protein [Acidobacteriota bacterium]